MNHSVELWESLRPKIERAISNKNTPKKFSGVNYYLAEYYLGKSMAESVADKIKYHNYLVRVYPNTQKGIWYIYVRRKS